MGLNQSNCWLTHIIYVDFVIGKWGEDATVCLQGEGAIPARSGFPPDNIEKLLTDI